MGDSRVARVFPRAAARRAARHGNDDYFDDYYYSDEARLDPRLGPAPPCAPRESRTHTCPVSRARCRGRGTAGVACDVSWAWHCTAGQCECQLPLPPALAASWASYGPPRLAARAPRQGHAPAPCSTLAAHGLRSAELRGLSASALQPRVPPRGLLCLSVELCGAEFGRSI